MFGKSFGFADLGGFGGRCACFCFVCLSFPIIVVPCIGNCVLFDHLAGCFPSVLQWIVVKERDGFLVDVVECRDDVGSFRGVGWLLVGFQPRELSNRVNDASNHRQPQRWRYKQPRAKCRLVVG